MIRAITLATCAGVLIAGCGSSSGTTLASQPAVSSLPTTTAKPTRAAARVARRTGTRVKVVSSRYGRVIADRRGQAFYLFAKETGGKSSCYGDCASAWPPVLTKGTPQARAGVTQDKLGTARRRDGKLQVTYAGHRLYYYRGDSPGNVLCQAVSEFGGLWLVVRPDGRAVK
jgi:predicted lipoprotein with Yx(FWY)xxD motif